MATEQEVLDDLIQAITNTNTSNNDFLKVLKEGRDQDVALRDGTVVPSLTKRVVNAFSNSDYLMKADNLASVVDKQEARNNLNVPTKEEVAQATETEKGTAKIATTAIAQAGVNDTDIITAKKLWDALNASGTAPISACRAYVVYSLTGGVVTIKKAFNVSSVVRNSVGNCTITFTTPMADANYPFSAKGAWLQNNIYAGDVVTAQNSIKTTTQLQVVGINRTQGSGDPSDLSEICVIVF